MFFATYAFLVIIIYLANPELSGGRAEQKLPYEPNQALRVFSKYVIDSKKNYKDSYVFEARLKIFRRNMVDNNRRNIASISAVFGVTPFSDLSAEEKKKIISKGCFCKNQLRKLDKKTAKCERPLTNRERRMGVDWRRHYAVTDVVDQGSCGASWAFAALAAIEGRYRIKHKLRRIFSVQQFLDCSGPNNNCNGGCPIDAIITNKEEFDGLETFNRYPFKGVQGTCEAKKEKTRVKIKSLDRFKGDENNLENVIYRRGPVIAVIEVKESFLSYKSGVATADDLDCTGDPVNYCVTIVGFGVEPSSRLPYWLLKNSLGTSWGEGGYMKLYRGNNACGIINQVFEPIVA